MIVLSLSAKSDLSLLAKRLRPLTNREKNIHYVCQFITLETAHTQAKALLITVFENITSTFFFFFFFHVTMVLGQH